MADPSREPYLQILEARPDLNGRFSTIRRIGANGGDGAFSLILEATDIGTGAKVALKVRHPELRDAYRIECFDREARLLGLLAGQPDIIQLLAPQDRFVESVSTPQGLTIQIPFDFYALELASTDVATIVLNGSWNPANALSGFRTMCRGVQRLHVKRLAHRDLKPENFLVMPDGGVRLSDLGTARYIDGSEPAILPRYDFPPGDLRYTSPEMLACLHDVDPAIAIGGDFFALGAILFELLTGTPLTLQIYDKNFAADLVQAMSAVSVSERRRVYDDIVGSISKGRTLPSVTSFGRDVPRCIVDRVDSLYRNMASIDYRKRLQDFDRIFGQIRTCLLVLENEEHYRRWRAQRRQWRVRRRARAARHATI